MDKFEACLKPVLDYEAGWVDNPADRGGETIFGVSRKNNPAWPGWAQVDEMRDRPDFPGCANSDAGLKALAVRLYREAYWNPIHGDEFPFKFALVALDLSVNSGPKTAVKMMQVSLGVVADGVIGQKTIKAAHEGGDRVVKRFLKNRLKFYHDIPKNKPDQEQWIDNWFGRIVELCWILKDEPPATAP